MRCIFKLLLLVSIFFASINANSEEFYVKNKKALVLAPFIYQTEPNGAVEKDGEISEERKNTNEIVQQLRGAGFDVDFRPGIKADLTWFKKIKTDEYSVVYISTHGNKNGGIATGHQIPNDFIGPVQSEYYKSTVSGVGMEDYRFIGLKPIFWDGSDFEHKLVVFVACNLMNSSINNNLLAKLSNSDGVKIGFHTSIKLNRGGRFMNKNFFPKALNKEEPIDVVQALLEAKKSYSPAIDEAFWSTIPGRGVVRDSVRAVNGIGFYLVSSNNAPEKPYIQDPGQVKVNEPTALIVDRGVDPDGDQVKVSCSFSGAPWSSSDFGDGGTSAVFNTGYSVSGTQTWTCYSEDSHGNKSDTSALNIEIIGPVAKPDLVVDSITAPSSATAGKNINVVVKVKNNGSTNTDRTFSAGVYLSTNSTISTADTHLGSCRLGSKLAVGSIDSCAFDVTIPSDTSPGSYYLGAVADEYKSIDELETSNNAGAGKAIKIQAVQSSEKPDLVITSLAYQYIPNTDTTNYTGTVKIWLDIENTGSSTGNIEFKTGYYLSEDRKINSADTILHPKCVHSSGIGGGEVQQCYDEIPIRKANYRKPEYYVGAIVDVGPGYNGVGAGPIYESNEKNNTAVSDKPFKLESASGDSIQFEQHCESYALTAVNQYQENIDNKCGFSGSEWHSNYQSHKSWCLTVDQSRSQSDIDSRNSLLSQCSNSKKPDLVIDFLQFVPTWATSGGEMNVVVKVKNIGDADATIFSTGYYLSNDSNITTSDNRISGCKHNSGVKAGETRTCDFSITIPSSTSDGIYDFGVIADDRFAIDESNESNNSYRSNSRLKITKTKP